MRCACAWKQYARHWLVGGVRGCVEDWRCWGTQECPEEEAVGQRLWSRGCGAEAVRLWCRGCGERGGGLCSCVRSGGEHEDRGDSGACFRLVVVHHVHALVARETGMGEEA